jgi:hypothetical protein
MTGLPHRRFLSLFGVLSCADLVLTLWLLQEDRLVYESNPIARWWLDRLGWVGLALFKVGMVLLTTVLAVVISRRHPRRGRQVLALACWAVGGVVLYSCSLARSVADQPERRQLSRSLQQSRQLDQSIRAGLQYQVLLDKLAEDLVARRCTLAEALPALASTGKAQDPAWLRLLHERYPNRSDRECLAANLMVSAFSLVTKDSARLWRVTRRLNADFRALFGRNAPALTLPAPAPLAG